MNLNDLKKEIPYKWKVQTVSKKTPKAQCVAYIDARDVMDLLDEVVGAENWQDKYEVIDGKFMAGIGIRVAYDRGEMGTDMYKEWVWKWDTGTSGNFETEKSEFSDAFKRAGVKWGIGRFLYDLDMRWVDTNKPGQGAFPVDSNGKRIWNLTEHFNNTKPTKTVTTPKKDTTTPKQPINTVDDAREALGMKKELNGKCEFCKSISGHSKICPNRNK